MRGGGTRIWTWMLWSRGDEGWGRGRSGSRRKGRERERDVEGRRGEKEESNVGDWDSLSHFFSVNGVRERIPLNLPTNLHTSQRGSNYSKHYSTWASILWNRRKAAHMWWSRSATKRMFSTSCLSCSDLSKKRYIGGILIFSNWSCLIKVFWKSSFRLLFWSFH